MNFADLFRPMIYTRKGNWIHLNTIEKEYGILPTTILMYFKINNIIISKQKDPNRTRIYVDEEWVKAMNDEDSLAFYTLRQSQVRDEELSDEVIQQENRIRRYSPQHATPKQVRLLARLSKNTHMKYHESKMVDTLLEECWVSKARANSIVRVLIGSKYTCSAQPNDRLPTGLLGVRKMRAEHRYQEQQMLNMKEKQI